MNRPAKKAAIGVSPTTAFQKRSIQQIQPEPVWLNNGKSFRMPRSRTLPLRTSSPVADWATPSDGSSIAVLGPFSTVDFSNE
jgi:hypothetical protein